MTTRPAKTASRAAICPGRSVGRCDSTPQHGVKHTADSTTEPDPRTGENANRAPHTARPDEPRRNDA